MRGGSREILLIMSDLVATFAFKDVALQFLGNLFEYFLVRRNQVGFYFSPAA